MCVKGVKVMSNIVFDYLVDSKLFLLSDSKYGEISIQELAKELDEYRNYIKKNYEQIGNEILLEKGDKFIQDTQIASVNCEDIDRITKASMIVSTYVLNDPIHNIHYDDISLNRHKKMMKRDIDERELKFELSKKVNYMKSLTSGVRCDTSYIKFIPFYYGAVDIKPNEIRIPSLKFEPNTAMVNWFKDKLSLYNLDEDLVLNKIPRYSNKIAVNFSNNENMDCFISQYVKPGCPNYIPKGEEYFNWVEQEKIKAINDTYAYLISKKNMYDNFNSYLKVNNLFEKEFYKKQDTRIRESSDREFLLKMNFIGMYDITFEKSMEMRRRYEYEFKRFQEKLSQDISILKVTNDEKLVEEHIEDMKRKYNEECAKLRSKILNVDGIISRNLVDVAITVITHLITKNVVATTMNSAKIIKNEFTYQVKRKKDNPIFYLSKF